MTENIDAERALTLEAELAAVKAHPTPDTPHTSIKMRTEADRVAFIAGYLAARRGSSVSIGKDGLPELPNLPQFLLTLLGDYGMALTDGQSEVDRQRLWEKLIDEINRYSRQYASDAIEIDRRARELSPMCERKTNDIMQREGYQKTGYVLMKDDPAARICVSDQGAVSWFTREQWNWLMFNRDHVEFTWPKPLGARLNEESPPAAQGGPDKIRVGQQFLEWNRTQTKAPVRIGSELGVVHKVLEIAASPLSSELEAKKLEKK